RGGFFDRSGNTAVLLQSWGMGICCSARCWSSDYIRRQTNHEAGYLLGSEEYDVPLNIIFGKVFGKLFDYVLVFFLYGLSVIMIAGTGAAFYDGFGVPSWL